MTITQAARPPLTPSDPPAVAEVPTDTGPRPVLPSRAARRWCLATAATVVAAHALKYPAMRAYVEANLGHGPDTTGIPADLLQTALQLGTAFGLLLGVGVSLLALSLVCRLSSRLTRGPGRVVPGALLGVVLVGLVIPDLVTAATGNVSPITHPAFYAAYLPLAGAAVWLSPSPPRPRWRVVDALLLAVLPFV